MQSVELRWCMGIRAGIAVWRRGYVVDCLLLATVWAIDFGFSEELMIGWPCG